MESTVTGRGNISQFNGLDVRNTATGNDFMDMSNIDSHEFPYLTTRRKNYYFPEDGIYKEITSAGETHIVPAVIQDAIAYDSDIYYVAKYQIKVAGVTITTFQLERIKVNGTKTECITANDFNTYSARYGESDYATAERKLVIMGANVIVYPDWIQYNISDNSITSLVKKFEIESVGTDDIYCYMGNESGIAYGGDIASSTVAVLTNPATTGNLDSYSKEYAKENNLYLLSKNKYNEAEEEFNLSSYYSTNSMWMNVDNYFCISVPYTCITGATSAKQALSKYNIEANKDIDWQMNVVMPNRFAEISGKQTLHRVNIVDGRVVLIFSGINQWNNTYGVGERVLNSTGTHYVTQENGIITASTPITISNKLYNNLDYIVSEGNRLFACSSEKHEIYASKLGDAGMWEQYQGISTDSYAATVGSPGDFTGATVFNNVPIFFKENCIHKINGNTPSSFNISYDYFDGIKKGCSRSITRVGNYLIFYSKNGFVYYTGSQPEKIDDNLGDLIFKNVSAGAKEGHYIAQVEDTNNNKYVLDFDTKTGMWYKHKPFDAYIHKFTNISADLYGFIYNDDLIPSIAGIGRNLNNMNNVLEEDDINFYVESGRIGIEAMKHKYISKLLFKLHLEFGASVLIYLKYDFNEDFELVYQNSNTEDKAIVTKVPIIPKRHEYLQYKIEGTGNVILYGIEYDLSEGSEIR